MTRRSIYRFALIAAVVAFAVALTALAQDRHYRGRKYKAPPPNSRVVVTILRKDDGKPIENAAVIWHLVGDKGNMELHTDQDGKSMIDVLPTGSQVLLQIIAKGYQTYGKVYKLDKPSIAIKVELKRPVGQYSIYEHHDIAVDTGTAGANKAPAAGKDAASKKDSKDKKDKPAESAKEDQSQAKPQKD